MRAEIRYKDTVEEISLPDHYWVNVKFADSKDNTFVTLYGGEMGWLEEQGIRVENASEITRTFPDGMSLTVGCYDIEGWDVTPQLLRDYRGMKHIEFQKDDLSVTISW